MKKTTRNVEMSKEEKRDTTTSVIAGVILGGVMWHWLLHPIAKLFVGWFIDSTVLYWGGGLFAVLVSIGMFKTSIMNQKAIKRRAYGKN